MFKILRNHESRILAVTRILLGVMFTCHGAQSCSARSAGLETRPSSCGAPAPSNSSAAP